jgi:hypothetical protein
MHVRYQLETFPDLRGPINIGVYRTAMLIENTIHTAVTRSLLHYTQVQLRQEVWRST